MAALNLGVTAPPAIALLQNLWNESWENHKKRQKYESNRYLPKIAMIFGVVPSNKNNDLRSGCAIYPRYLYIYLFVCLFIYLFSIFFEPSTFTPVFCIRPSMHPCIQLAKGK
jgi:hypothetical protein